MDQGTLQSPAMLSQLLETIKRLENEVCDVQQQNETLVQDKGKLAEENECLRTQLIEQYREAGFKRFKELPKEIRCLIWRFALTTSQTLPSYKHILMEVHYSTINITMQACKEAREEGLSLKLPYTSIRTRSYGYLNITFKNYINPENDIVWVKEGSHPSKPMLQCSCHDSMPWNRSDHTTEFDVPLLDCLCQPQPALKAVAIGIFTWHEWTSIGNLNEECMFSKKIDLWINFYNAQKVYIVVESRRLKSRKEICFTRASEDCSVPRSFDTVDGLPTSPVDWQAMGEIEMRKLEQYKVNFVARCVKMNSMGYLPTSLLEAHRKRMASWKTPSVEFMRYQPSNA